MNTVIIENKEYVILSKKQYETLRTKAALKSMPERILTLKQGKKLAYQMIDAFAKDL